MSVRICGTLVPAECQIDLDLGQNIYHDLDQDIDHDLDQDIYNDRVHDGLRDFTRTSAGAENVVAIKWIMGHCMSGDDDKYAFREAAETKAVLEKVERVVFGENS